MLSQTEALRHSYNSNGIPSVKLPTISILLSILILMSEPVEVTSRSFQHHFSRLVQAF